MDSVHIISDRVGVISVYNDLDLAKDSMEQKIRELQHTLRNQGAPEEVVQIVARERFKLETYQINKRG